MGIREGLAAGIWCISDERKKERTNGWIDGKHAVIQAKLCIGEVCV